MADITMCVGTSCALREKCYRYTATPNEHRQSIADFTKKWILVKDVPHCPEYVPNAKVSEGENER